MSVLADPTDIDDVNRTAESIVQEKKTKSYKTRVGEI
jgi:hypothetical protein